MYNGRRNGGGVEAITPPSHANMEKVGDHIKVMCYMHRSKGPGWHMSILVFVRHKNQLQYLYKNVSFVSIPTFWDILHKIG